MTIIVKPIKNPFPKSFTVWMIGLIIVFGIVAVTVLQYYSMRKREWNEYDQMLEDVGGDPYKLHAWCIRHFTIVDKTVFVDNPNPTLLECIRAGKLTPWELAQFEYIVMGHDFDIESWFVFACNDTSYILGALFYNMEGTWMLMHTRGISPAFYDTEDIGDAILDFIDYNMPDHECRYIMHYGDPDPYISEF